MLSVPGTALVCSHNIGSLFQFRQYCITGFELVCVFFFRDYFMQILPRVPRSRSQSRDLSTKVSVSRTECQGLGNLRARSRSWSQVFKKVLTTYWVVIVTAAAVSVFSVDGQYGRHSGAFKRHHPATCWKKNVYTAYDQLLLKKISEIVAARSHILRLKCTKFNFSCGSIPNPAYRAYSTPPVP